MYVATVSLSACGGCEKSLLSIGEPLVALLSEHSISFSSLLLDRHTISPSDVVLVSGCIRSSEEQEVASVIARTSRKIVAVGTCAVYGGVGGLARLDQAVPESDGSSLPEIFPDAAPIDSSVAVELYVPGCPPPPRLIFDALKSVLEGYTPLHFDSTVCSDCPREVPRKATKTISLHPGPGVPPDTCLLSAGVLCMGPVTRGGCRAVCPAVGAVCSGCRGPSDMVLSSQLHSIYSDTIACIARTSSAREDKVAKQVDAMLDLLYLYTGKDPETRARARERVPGE
ncbi:MAG: NADH-quinone oxidoreductase subunit B family protein [Candidatus Geothermincolia bacterium]